MIFKFGINNQSSTVDPGGDLVKVIRAVGMTSNSIAVAEVFSKFRAYVFSGTDSYIEGVNTLFGLTQRIQGILSKISRICAKS